MKKILIVLAVIFSLLVFVGAGDLAADDKAPVAKKVVKTEKADAKACCKDAKKKDENCCKEKCCKAECCKDECCKGKKCKDKKACCKAKKRSRPSTVEGGAPVRLYHLSSIGLVPTVGSFSTSISPVPIMLLQVDTSQI